MTKRDNHLDVGMLLLKKLLIVLAASIALNYPASAAEPATGDKTGEHEQPSAPLSEQPQSTRSSVSIDGKRIEFTTSTGHLTIRNTRGDPTASLFYVAYTADTPKQATRPVTFVFNGGPGSSSMWLVLSGLGPMRLQVDTDAAVPPAPYRLTPSAESVIDRTDLVFIDAVGTGLSRAVGQTNEKDFFSLDSDLDAYAKAVTRYLGINQRWNSPKYLMGESYGTIRAAGLSQLLLQRGVQLNGVLLLSPLLDYSSRGLRSDQRFATFLPTLSAIAWFHHRVPGIQNVDQLVQEVRSFALGPYLSALAMGDTLAADERDAIAKKVAYYTGLSQDYVENANLRIDSEAFRKELLHSEGNIVGRVDGRFAGPRDPLGSVPPDYDAAETAIRSAYVATINDYLFGTLGIKTDLTYRPENYETIGDSWDWRHRQPGMWEPGAGVVSGDFAATMRRNPNMKVLALLGYYDAATPFLAAEYDIAHLELVPSLRSNVTIRHYATGHLLYIDPSSRLQMSRDIKAFYDASLKSH